MELILMAVLGAIGGSFACCQAWRWHERAAGKSGWKKLPARSVCMKCGHRLKWWENIPVVSWCGLRGRCRKCGEKIGAAEILAEVLGAAAFVGCYAGVVGCGAYDGWTWARLGCLLALMVVLGVLAVYDGKWGELPAGLLLLAVVVAGLALMVKEVPMMMAGVEMRQEVLSVVGAVGLLAGLYFVLLKCSRGKLVGDGDWILGLALALALADWWLALMTLVAANLLATGWAVLSRKRKIYFGPFMVVAFALAVSLEKVICLANLL